MGVTSFVFDNLLFVPSTIKIYTIGYLRVFGLCNKTLFTCNADITSADAW